MNPRTVLAVSRFQGECIRPLCHATVDKGNGRRIVAGLMADCPAVPGKRVVPHLRPPAACIVAGLMLDCG